MKWRYSLRWKRPGPCPGEPELASEVVEAGKPAPESVMSLWVAGAGYAVCVDFLYERPIRRWSDERRRPRGDGIWRVVLTGSRPCLQMNSLSGN